MDSYIFYGLAIVLLILSFVKDKKKTKMALKKAWKAFENILPEFLVVILLVGFLLAILNPETISKIIGAESGWWCYTCRNYWICNPDSWIRSVSNCCNSFGKRCGLHADCSFCVNNYDGWYYYNSSRNQIFW